MELRDFFAAQIASAIIRTSMSEPGKVASPQLVAYNAYLFADALVKQSREPVTQQEPNANEGATQ